MANLIESGRAGLGLATLPQKPGISPSRLTMPLCFAALISGMMTLVATTPNLVVNTVSVRDDRRAGRVHCVDDSGLFTGEHARGHAGRIHLRRLPACRSAVQPPRHDRGRL